MSDAQVNAERTPAPELRKNWRFYAGMTCFVLAWILPAFSPLVIWLQLPKAVTAFVIGALLVGGPEVFMILAVLFWGRETLNHYMAKIRSLMKIRIPSRPVSRLRYYLGLTMMIGSVLPLYLYGYFPGAMPTQDTVKIKILAGADVLFIVSFFVAGSEFWEKFKRLFVYEGRYAGDEDPSK
ncbi:hypothetical protein [Syntrophobacter fumaroxidans]|uniref:Transporter suffix domain-containing protein n=1 Tax=Syntrophobacter fumaroxidans (strain DSM 10017 / MPOB) TaxID=335543 RepID=A0LNU7_SYNFM|nr:hypothetical protein [Syntrophobacter fumaroxidans]ABK19099.1 hypothetical protein Sfum_3427 [Syntrophobacter fumaroxidans MPOB]